jgi:hypothetical protein
MIQTQASPYHISGIISLIVVSEDEKELRFWSKNYEKMWSGYYPHVTKVSWDDKSRRWKCIASRWSSCD